jgi:hypothetical protein
VKSDLFSGFDSGLTLLIGRVVAIGPSGSRGSAHESPFRGRYIWLLIYQKILKLPPSGSDVGYLEFIEAASLGLCSLATFLWMAIGSLSRTTKSEIMAQRVIATICLTSAALLFSLHYFGGEIWGSKKIARPFAVIAVMMALASVMNIKGKDVQGEANPHSIMKSRNEE